VAHRADEHYDGCQYNNAPGKLAVEKEVGAHRAHILFQFIAEAMAITFAGAGLRESESHI